MPGAQSRCATKWNGNHTAYRCKTCGTTDSRCAARALTDADVHPSTAARSPRPSCMCVDCFRFEDHAGHDFSMYQVHVHCGGAGLPPDLRAHRAAWAVAAIAETRRRGEHPGAQRAEHRPSACPAPTSTTRGPRAGSARGTAARRSRTPQLCCRRSCASVWSLFSKVRSSSRARCLLA
jgi:hypothetical protein